MNLTIASDVSARAPSLRLGVLSVHGLSIRERDDALSQQLDRVTSEFAARCGVNAIAGDPRIVSVRRLFKAIGVDPSRYRPSSEALVRRVAQGKGLYSINSAVDVNNWCSLEERLPFGIYDAAHVGGDVLLRLGRENEAYEGIGKSLISLEGKLVLSDVLGPFGSPISDSTRAMVTPAARDIHLVVFAPGVAADALRAILERAAARLAQYNGGGLERAIVV